MIYFHFFVLLLIFPLGQALKVLLATKREEKESLILKTQRMKGGRGLAH